MSEFKWSPRDNDIARLELKLSRLLTRELNERPSVTLPLMLKSIKVHRKAIPILSAMTKVLGHPPQMDAKTWREGEKRKVTVSVT